MSVLDEVLRDAQPAYAPSVRGILVEFLELFGDAGFDGVDRDEFALHAIRLIEGSDADIGRRLGLLKSLSSLGWWSDVKIGDRETAALAAVTRKIQFQSAKGVAFRLETAAPAARRNHAIFVGALVGVMHSPTRGSFDYVRALAVDPHNARIDVFYSGTLTAEMKAYGAELLGRNSGRVTYVPMDGNSDWLTQAAAGGPYSYHFWCEDPFALHIGLLALLGPTVMFTCGDVAPVQYADVYWYGHDQAYMAALWRRQGAPEHFIPNYQFLKSTPLNLPKPQQARTRPDLGIEPDDIIVVSAGNRLGTDLDQPFVDGLGAFLRGHPQVRWMTVGGLHDYWNSTFRSVFGRQFIHIPYDHDLPSLFAVCDIFANPFRVGGGHSSVIAVDAGAVVLTRGDLGDVGACVPPVHRAHDAADYFERLQQLVDDSDLRSAWRTDQKAFLARCADQEAFAVELREVCDLAYGRFTERLPVVLETLYAQT